MNIKKILIPEPKLTEQEIQIKKIFETLLEKPDTNKILAGTNEVYLSNVKEGITAAISGECILIEDGNDTMSIKCEYNVLKVLANLVNNAVETNVHCLHKRMTDNQTKKLKDINEKISCGTVAEEEKIEENEK